MRLASVASVKEFRLSKVGSLLKPPFTNEENPFSTCKGVTDIPYPYETVIVLSGRQGLGEVLVQAGVLDQGFTLLLPHLL